MLGEEVSGDDSDDDHSLLIQLSIEELPSLCSSILRPQGGAVGTRLVSFQLLL